MPVVNRFAELHEEIAGWRRDIHAHPELQYEVHRTAGLVAAKLREFGVDEVVEGIGRTGVVGVIRGAKGGSGRTIGLRADMDALPIQEARDIAHKSTVPGRMHACGHDGHTAMLLGAAKHLSETRNFDGTAVVIFQPAEEGGNGAEAMVGDGLMERWGIEEVYGLHNAPNRPLGSFSLRTGPIMAAADDFTVAITGHGGHAARPHLTVDAALVAAQVLIALQSVVARSVDPMANAVLSVTQIHAGDANNVIPQTARLEGTLRTLSEEVRALAKTRMAAIVEMTARAYGAEAALEFGEGCPVVVNHAAQAEFAAGVAADVAGAANVADDIDPVMGAEDFSFMLNARPGAFIYLGQGEGPNVHHPDYDFNDEIIPLGCSYWVRLVETALPAS